MAALTHYSKVDATARTSTSTTATEVTQYTVNWSDLTGAGFSAGDDVFILVQASIGASGANDLASIDLGHGTTFAGRTFFTNAFGRVEPVDASAIQLHNYMFIQRHTLVTSENLYVGLATATPLIATVDDFSIIILRLNELTENVDFKYASATHSGNAPTAYDTSGASVTIPAAGEDWIAFAECVWAIDEVNGLDALTDLNVDGVSHMELRSEGEDLTEQIHHGIIDAIASPASGATIQVRYRNETSGIHDALHTKLFLLRLGVFEDYDLVRSTATITHSALDTMQEFAGFPTFALTTTGDIALFAQSRHVFVTDVNKSPYGQAQIANTDIVAGYRRTTARGNGAADQNAVTFALVSAQTAGTLDIDFDIADDLDVTPNYSATQHTAIVFSFNRALVVLTGTLFTKAPTFFTGTVTRGAVALTGSLFVKAPTFFAGVIGQRLSGSLFVKAPTFNTGTVTATYNLTGTLFTKVPTFNTGTVTATYNLTGTLFTKAPTFFTGTVTSAVVTLNGILFVKAPTFPQGVVTAGAVNLVGSLFQKAPTFFTGTVTAGTVTLTGTLFTKAPTFPTGTIGQTGTLFGNLFVKAPTFFTGSLAQGGPSFWQPSPVGWTANPSGFVRVGRYGPSPWGAELSGQRFEKAPTFPVGTVS